MSEDRQIGADLQVKNADQTVGDFNRIADSVDNTSDSLLGMGDAAKTASSGLDDFGANRMQQQSLSRGGQLPDDNGGGGSSKSGGFGKTARDAQRLAGAANKLGVEFDDTAMSIIGVTPLLGTMATAIQAVAASITAAEVAFPPLAAVAAATAVAAGIAAASVAFYNDSVEENEQAVRDATDAELAYNDALSLTTDEIEKQITTNEELLAANQRDQETIQKGIDKLNDPSSGLGGFIFGLADGLGLVGDAGDELADQMNVLEDEERALTLETEGLTDAIDSAAVAANDAAEALLEESKQLGDNTRFRQKAMELDAEGRDRLAQSLDNDREAIEAELGALQAAANQTEETKERIAELEDELGNLDEQTAILNSEVVQAAIAQNEYTKALEESSKVAEQVAKGQEKLGKLETERNQLINENMMDSLKVAGEANAELKKIRDDGRESLIDFNEEAKDQEILDEQDHRDKMSQIRDDARLNERDLIRSDDFIRAFFSKEKEQTALSNERKAFDKQTALREQMEGKRRNELIENLTEDLELQQQASEEKLAEQMIADEKELMAQEDKIREQEKLVQQGQDEISQIMGRSANEQVRIAADAAQAQIDFMSQVASAAQQMLAGGAGGIGSLTQNFNVAGGGAGGFTNSAMQQMQDQMLQLNQLTAGLTIN